MSDRAPALVWVSVSTDLYASGRLLVARTQNGLEIAVWNHPRAGKLVIPRGSAGYTALNNGGFFLIRT